MRKNIFFAGLAFILLIGISFATPCLPMQLWGTVTINEIPSPDGILVEVRAGSALLGTDMTSNGWYGNESVFYIESCTGGNIKFYVKGIYAGEAVFSPLGVFQKNLSISTECGNAVCEPGEDSLTCCTDCGCSSGYYCESNSCVQEEQETGGGGFSGGGVMYSLPAENESYCGNEICDSNETCVSCSEDCGACPAECSLDSDCSDGNDCTINSCDSGECVYTVINYCADSDNCCPGVCDSGSDNDCDSEQSDRMPEIPESVGDSVSKGDSVTGAAVSSGETSGKSVASKIISYGLPVSAFALLLGLFFLKKKKGKK